MVIIRVGKMALWVAHFLATLGYRLLGQSISLRVNIRGVISFIANLEFYRCTKNIQV